MPSYPAAQELIASREKRPIVFRLSLILFPIGLILGILYVWQDAYRDSLTPAASVGRGQLVGPQRLADIQAKLSELSKQPEPTRSRNLNSFLEGTLGSPNNAGLTSSQFTLERHQMSGTWQAFQRPGESRRAGITLFIELPDATQAAYSPESKSKLASTINAVEGLMRLPQAQRDVTLIFHPPGNPLDLPSGELRELQAQLELKGAGELYRLQVAEVPDNPQLNPETNATGFPLAQQGDFGSPEQLSILNIQEDGQLIITPPGIYTSEETTQALHDWLKRRTQ